MLERMSTSGAPQRSQAGSSGGPSSLVTDALCSPSPTSGRDGASALPGGGLRTGTARKDLQDHRRGEQREADEVAGRRRQEQQESRDDQEHALGERRPAEEI